MGTVGWLIRYQVRRGSHLLAAFGLFALALVTALAATATLLAAGAATRTAQAYPDYLARAHIGDVEINPSLVSRDIDSVVRRLPGVRAVTSDALFEAGIDRHPRPRTQAELDADPSVVLLRGSTDGRYVRMDRPALTAGRLPTGRHEALVSADLGRRAHIAVGDVLPLSFWSRQTESAGVTAALPPIGVERVTVVGIAHLPDEVLPDGLYPRGTIIVSPDVAARYDCLPRQPGADASMAAFVQRMAPKRCATSYRYYSLDTGGDPHRLNQALVAFNEAADRLTATLPPAVRQQHIGYTLVAKTTTADERRRVERSTDPNVVALWVLAAAAAAITVLVVGLGAARNLLRSQDDQLHWWRLGLTRRERVATLAAPVLVAVGVGLAIATLAAWLLSPIAPIGNVRSVDPAPARSLPGATGLVLAGLVAALVVVVLLLSWRAAGRVGARGRRGVVATPRALGRTAGRPEVAEGLRAATPTNRGAGLVLASGAAAVAVFVTAVVFGSSLSTLVSTPAAYGWSWDVATIDNYGYGGIKLSAVRSTLAERDDVAAWTALGFSNAITLDGDPVPAVYGFDRSSDVDLTLVRGRLPHQKGEVALGARTAADRGLAVGDAVRIAGYEVPKQSAHVTGIVVLPALGPFRADRTAPGVGMLVPQAMLDRKQVGSLVSFVGIRLRSGAEPAAVHRELHRAFGSWNPDPITTFEFARPVRPPEIIDARSMRFSPLLVGGLLVVAATIGLAVAIAMSVRARRRDLAVLRTLGFTRRQLASSVVVQTLGSVLGALVIGLPAGIVLGQWAWRAFAGRLGVLAHPTVAAGWIVATAAGAVVIAMLAAALPAGAAARTRPATLLRSE